VDNVLRGGRLVLALAVVGACRAEPGAAVGVSSPRAVTEPPSPRTVDASAAIPSPVAADFRDHMTRVSERGVSHGHADRFDGVVWTNDAAHTGWEGPGQMPDGAVLVEEAIEKTVKGDRAAGLLVMEKHAEGWRFVVVDAGGHVVEWTRVEACAACHRDAPRDFVFHLDGAAPAPAASK
jgi:hypothetical protein